MCYLRVTLIDVGWGDSILIESTSGIGRPRFALIDSNDNAEREYWPTRNFLRKHFGSREDEFDYTEIDPLFDFVMVSHDHSDHGTGLKRIMSQYGTQKFWYPKTDPEHSPVIAHLQSYANHHMVDIDNQAVDREIDIGNLGDTALDVLWPPPDHYLQDSNKNNNSIVLLLTLENQSILLTGDAEGEVWSEISDQVPLNTVAVKVPHHGSRNGILSHGGTTLLNRLSQTAGNIHMGISCHPNFPNRYDLPHPDVVNSISEDPYHLYRTDLHYHITFTVRDSQVVVRYSHE